MKKKVKEVMNMKIKNVSRKSDSILEFTDTNDGKHLINVSHWMNLPILNYQELQDPSYFKLVRVAENHNTIEWPNGQDIAPEDLEKFSVPID